MKKFEECMLVAAGKWLPNSYKLIYSLPESLYQIIILYESRLFQFICGIQERKNKITHTQLCQILNDKELKQMTLNQKTGQEAKSCVYQNLHANSKICRAL